MIDMAKKEILPAVLSYSAELSDTLLKKKAALPELACALNPKPWRGCRCCRTKSARPLKVWKPPL